MKEIQNTVILAAIPPGIKKDNAAFVANVIDTADADYIEFVGVLGDTDIAMAALKVQESDTKTNDTTLENGADVKDVTTKPGADDDNKTFVIGVDLRKNRKRYLQLQGTAGDGATGTYLAAVAILQKSGVRSSAAADRGMLFAEYA